MKFILRILLICFGFASCVSLKSTRSVLSKNIVIYSATHQNDTAKYSFNTSYTFLGNDGNLNWVAHPLGYADNYGIPDSIISETDNGRTVKYILREVPYVRSELPFRLSKEANHIWISYNQGGARKKEPLCSLKIGDTIVANNMFNLAKIGSMGYHPGKTWYVGKQSVNFLNQRLPCYVFEQHLPKVALGGPDYHYKIYLETQTLLPVRVEYTLVREMANNSTTITQLAVF